MSLCPAYYGLNVRQTLNINHKNFVISKDSSITLRFFKDKDLALKRDNSKEDNTLAVT